MLNKTFLKVKENGFTLAEVLIALVVIGIIAAITVPTLIQKYQEQAFKSALKKNYSNLSQAFRLAYGTNYDDFRDWEYVHSSNFTKELYNKLSKYMHIEKNCGTSNRNDCWADKTYAKNGQYGKWFLTDGKWSGGGEAYGIALNDGTTIFIDIWVESTVNSVGVTKNLFGDANLGFFIDVNGVKKPNVVGKDIFAFVLTEKGITPGGADNNSVNCDNRSTNNNWDCAAKVLRD
jgi:prepilin-type N-terminal cleavage/methylation domain-containing protein